MTDDPRMRVHRVTGILEKFEPGKYEGFIRVDDCKLHVTTSTRGQLMEGGSIDRWINGHRFDPLKPGTPVVLDVTYDREGKSPLVALWAPVPPRQRSPQR